MKPPAPSPTLRMALLIYLPMLVGGYAFVHPPHRLGVRNGGSLALGLGCAAILAALVIVLSGILARRTAWGQAFHAELRSVLGPLRPWEILALALLSSLGEELLFRGVIQGQLGLWTGALIFGAFHFPYRRVLVPWSGFVLLMGVVLGVLTLVFDSLWPPILLHFTVNFFNLHQLMLPFQED